MKKALTFRPKGVFLLLKLYSNQGRLSEVNSYYYFISGVTEMTETYHDLILLKE